jgi:hypothetical protein
MLHTAAYWLMLDLRAAAPRKSRWRAATFETIRTAFLKIAARIETLKTRIRVSFPRATPNAPMITHMLATIAARAPRPARHQWRQTFPISETSSQPKIHLPKLPSAGQAHSRPPARQRS